MLYGSEAAYRAAFDQAIEDTVAAGFLLEADAEQMRDDAARVSIAPAETDSP